MKHLYSDTPLRVKIAVIVIGEENTSVLLPAGGNTQAPSQMYSLESVSHPCCTPGRMQAVDQCTVAHEKAAVKDEKAEGNGSVNAVLCNSPLPTAPSSVAPLNPKVNDGGVQQLKTMCTLFYEYSCIEGLTWTTILI